MEIGGLAFWLKLWLLIPPHDATCHPSMNETFAVSSAVDRQIQEPVNHRAGFEATEWHHSGCFRGATSAAISAEEQLRGQALIG